MPIEQADGVYVVQVAIQNSSDTALTLTVGVLNPHQPDMDDMVSAVFQLRATSPVL